MAAITGNTRSPLSGNHQTTIATPKIIVIAAAVCAAVASIFLLPGKAAAVLASVLMGGGLVYVFWGTLRNWISNSNWLSWCDTFGQAVPEIIAGLQTNHAHVTVGGGHNQEPSTPRWNPPVIRRGGLVDPTRNRLGGEAHSPRTDQRVPVGRGDWQYPERLSSTEGPGYWQYEELQGPTESSIPPHAGGRAPVGHGHEPDEAPRRQTTTGLRAPVGRRTHN